MCLRFNLRNPNNFYFFINLFRSYDFDSYSYLYVLGLSLTPEAFY